MRSRFAAISVWIRRSDSWSVEKHMNKKSRRSECEDCLTRSGWASTSASFLCRRLQLNSSLNWFRFCSQTRFWRVEMILGPFRPPVQGSVSLPKAFFTVVAIFQSTNSGVIGQPEWSPGAHLVLILRSLVLRTVPVALVYLGFGQVTLAPLLTSWCVQVMWWPASGTTHVVAAPSFLFFFLLTSALAIPVRTHGVMET